MKRLLVSLLLAIAAMSLNLPIEAQDAKPAEKNAAQASRTIPFRGKVASVNQPAKTFKVGERTFHITADSRIMKAGKAATLDEVAVGEEVGGAYREGDDKKLNVVSLRVGPRPDAAPKQEEKK